MTPFPLATGLALIFGYSLLGAGWLVLKTEGDLQDSGATSRARVPDRRPGRNPCASASGPDGECRYRAAWFSWPNIGFLSPVPIITALIAIGEWYALTRQYELMPFLGAIGLFLMSFIGIAISLWPMIVPYHYTLWQAASSESTQAFLLIGTLFLLPIILMYTAWSYWVFRGKVSETLGSAYLSRHSASSPLRSSRHTFGNNAVDRRRRDIGTWTRSI